MFDKAGYETGDDNEDKEKLQGVLVLRCPVQDEGSVALLQQDS